MYMGAQKYSPYGGSPKDSFQFWYRAIVLTCLPLLISGLAGVGYLLWHLTLESAKTNKDIQELRVELADLPQMRQDIYTLQVQVNINRRWIELQQNLRSMKNQP